MSTRGAGVGPTTMPARAELVWNGIPPADGARRSAQIDREEADCLPVGEARERCLAATGRWDRQAEHLGLGVGEGS